MQANDIEILALVVGAFSLFGCVLGWASWDEFRRTRRIPPVNKKQQTTKLDIRHVLAVLAGLMCFGVVFMYTGEADLLIAISSGLAASAASYLAANTAITLHKPGG